MPSTYSTHLLLELMADGENEGLWGDITNTNLEILGRAISGSTNVTLADTSHTLTVSQAALSEGHYSVLVLGGAPTGTNTITINPNTVPRIYLVKNDSGQDAVFTQGSGGDATVVNGDIGILFSDGGGASASVTDLTPGLMRNSENLSGLADAAAALQNLGVTATASELNALDGATLDISAVTATAAEVNTLDGFTGDTDDLNYAKDLRATGVTTTEFDKLDGLTATAAELNTLDGITASTAELNTLDGVTASTADLNKTTGIEAGADVTNAGNVNPLVDAHLNQSTATADQVLTWDGSDYSWEDSSGGGGAELVATGSIPGAGTPVVLRSDGTVQVVAPIPIDDTGTATVFSPGNISSISATYDSAAGKVVIAYIDSDNSNSGTALVGTVSGSSISFGSPVVFHSNPTSSVSATYDSAAGKVVIAYAQDTGNTNIDDGYAVVGTVSGSSISFSGSGRFANSRVYEVFAAYDSAAGKVVIFCRKEDYISSQYVDTGEAIVGTVSGSSISFGSPVIFSVDYPVNVSPTYDSAAGKVVVAFRALDSNSAGRAIVGTVSGSSISFGSPVTFDSGGAFNISATYDSAAGKVVIAYRDSSNSGTAIVGTVSGSSITFDSPVVFNSDGASNISATYDSVADKVVIAYQDDSNFSRAITYSSTGVGFNPDDFVGFAQGAASDGDTVLVATNQQIDANQTALTPKSTYYLDFDGTLTTSDTGYTVAGFALDANTIRTGG